MDNDDIAFFDKQT